MKKIVILLALLALLTSCATHHATPPAKDIRIDSVVVDRWHVDSVVVRDSIIIDRAADTVVIREVSIRDRLYIRVDTISVVSRDTIYVPHEVVVAQTREADIKWWQKALMFAGGAFCLIIIVKLREIR